MLVTTEQLSTFSGVYPDNDDLQKIYINSASDLIAGYVGYTPEDYSGFEETKTYTVYLYSTDGETFYTDEERQSLAVIPSGVTPVQTLLENQWSYDLTIKEIVVPDVFKLVCLEIATLIQQEESQNIGVNSKSFGDSGSRSFLNVVNYDKYLARLSIYRRNEALDF